MEITFKVKGTTEDGYLVEIFRDAASVGCANLYIDREQGETDDLRFMFLDAIRKAVLVNGEGSGENIINSFKVSYVI